MDCIDDPDISIRLQALDLSMGMLNSDNLVDVVERLMRQLRYTPISVRTAQDGRSSSLGVQPAADSEGEDPEEILRPTEEHGHEIAALPTEYKLTTMQRIIEMCSRDTYSNVNEFEWYVGILMQLVKLVPTDSADLPGSQARNEQSQSGSQNLFTNDIPSLIGWELRNVAARVSTVRPDIVQAAYSLMVTYANGSPLTYAGTGANGVLAFAAWIFGEYFETCRPRHASMEPLIHPKVHLLPPVAISAYLQAIPKVFASLISRESGWSPERQSMTSLIVARVIHFLEPLATHPSVDVQERAVEFLELMRVMQQAVADHMGHESGPLLLMQTLPSLFEGFELNPVAPTAQRKVPVPTEVDLDVPINGNLAALLHDAEQDSTIDTKGREFEVFYNQRPERLSALGPAIDTLPSSEPDALSYQITERLAPDGDISRKRFQRREKNRDDPFYIGNDDTSSGTSTPFHDILKGANGEDVDVDSIPIMDLDLGDKNLNADSSAPKKPKKKHLKKVHVARDETLDNGTDDAPIKGLWPPILRADANPQQQRSDKAKGSLLQVDSSGLSAFSLTGDEKTSEIPVVGNDEMPDEEMAKALAEVERLRLEMQRASERVEASDGAPPEGTLVKKKKKKKAKLPEGVASEVGASLIGSNTTQGPQAEESVPIKKKKKKRRPEIP